MKNKYKENQSSIESEQPENLITEFISKKSFKISIRLDSNNEINVLPYQKFVLDYSKVNQSVKNEIQNLLDLNYIRKV